MLVIFVILVSVQIFDSEGATLQNEETSTIKCVTKEGHVGECVHSYLCDRYTNTIVEDGSNVLDPRTNRQDTTCVIPMVCCQIAKVKTLQEVPGVAAYARLAQDMESRGCGWRNKEGVEVNVTINNVSEKHAKPGEFPWAVSIVRLISVDVEVANYGYLGGGSLIHDRAILTSAHLFNEIKNNDELYVVVGDFNQQSMYVLPRRSIKVKKVEIHHGYNQNNLLNDFALVFLVKSIKVASHVNFICLPPKSIEVKAGSRCISSGWGKDGHDVHQYIINKVELPVVDRNICQTQLRSFPNMGPFFELHDSFMCARSENGVDSCKGNGGSSLACPIEGQSDRYMLSGIVTWSSNCSFDGLPSMYARVASARQWIDDKMEENGYSITSYTDY